MILRWIAIGIFSFLSIGCAFRQFPDRAKLPTSDKTALKKILKEIYENADGNVNVNGDVNRDANRDVNVSVDGNENENENGNENGNGNGDKKRSIRNEQIELGIAAIDVEFEKFRKKFIERKTGTDVIMSILSIGAGTAATLFSGGGSTSRILIAISAVLMQSNRVINNTLFFERAITALLEEMIATRQEVMVRIHHGMRQSYDLYPLAMAMKDLRRYEFAGSIPGAVAAISADAERKLRKAIHELEREHEHNNNKK